MAPPAATLPNSKSILVVDDEPAILKILGLALALQGIPVRQASTGEQAVEIYRRHQRDIGAVLLDVRMAPLDGPQTLAQLRLLDLDVPVYFMTGHAAEYSESDLFAAGATRIFGKPFRNLGELVRLLKEAAQEAPGRRLSPALEEPPMTNWPDGTRFFSDRPPRQDDDYLTTRPLRETEARATGASGTSALKGGTMMSNDSSHLSSQEMGERFDLLATDAKEYAVFLVGLGGHLICWNAGAERIFGYQSNEIIGQHYSRFFLPEDVRNGQPEHELQTALADGRADSKCWQVRKDGSRFWCRSTVTPLLDENKQARSFARVMHDLTESEAEQDQRKRADGLAEANRSKEVFMALLSHELRSPLSPILNALNILRQMKTTDPIIAQAGNIIDRQVGKMVRLVDDLLDISRITKGKLRLTKEEVELRGVVNAAAESARPFMDARKHEFSVSLPVTPLWVEADSARIEQVVVNLLNNAAKYTDPGGLIRLTVNQEEAEAVIRVRDNGVGIAPELLPHVFELFAQVDGSLGRSYGGLGIGLALARNLVEMHEGRLQASSAGLGKGCEFTIKLPVLAESVAQQATTVLEPGQPPVRSLRVLVVEDNVDAGDSLSLLLRLHGHEVQVARTGPMALEMASASRLDVVLLDIGLPGMDGYQVAQHLRELPGFQEVTICALTGYTPSEADRQRQQETGFDHYYVKPVDLAKLLELFKTVGPPAS